MARTKQIAVYHSANRIDETPDDNSMSINRNTLTDDNSSNQNRSVQDYQNLQTQESLGHDDQILQTQEVLYYGSDDDEEKHMLEGHKFPRRHVYKYSQPMDPLEYRRLLSEKIRTLKEGYDLETNLFFIDQEGRELEWPNASKPNVLMKSIYPKTSNVDLLVNNDSFVNKTHAVVCNNVARKMIFTNYKYDDHHSSPSFVSEYNKYVLGMMYKYKVLMEAILELPHEQIIPEETLNQRHYACIHVQKLATAVFNYNTYPIGKMNEQYIRHNVEGIESEEDVKFVLAMSNCQKFELESRFLHNPRDSPYAGFWIIYTKVFFPHVNGDLNNELYAFGWNRTIYPKPDNYSSNWPYGHYESLNNKKRKLREDNQV